MSTNRGNVAPLPGLDPEQIDATAPPRARRGRRPTGRHEKAVKKALDAAGMTTDRSLLTRTGLLATAAALDSAELKRDAYASAQLTRELREWLKDLDLLDPAEQGELGGDGFGGPQ